MNKLFRVGEVIRMFDGTPIMEVNEDGEIGAPSAKITNSFRYHKYGNIRYYNQLAMKRKRKRRKNEL